MREEREDPPIQFVQVDGVRLAYRESGDATKPPMVLLHGLALTSAYVWRALISHFKDDYRIIAFDLLGHGDSDKPHHGYEATNQAQLIAQAMESIYVPRALLIGHSYSGILAARLAINWPSRVEKLVLYDAPLPDGTVKHLLRLLRKAPHSATLSLSLLLLPGAGTILNLLPRRPFVKFAFSQLRVVYHRNLLDSQLLDQAVRNSGVSLAEDVRKVVLREDIVHHLGRLTMPTLLVVGDHDLLLPVSDAEEFSDLIAESRLRVISKAGHDSLLDNPTEFNTILEEFLAPMSTHR